MSETRVLIVDDDAALLQALTETLDLRMKGVAVETCTTAKAALKHIGRTDYDAIVADIKMPGMDGLELLDRIRDLRPETPTLLITGHGEHDLAIRALRGGAHDYVQKPIDREYFVGSLSHAVEVRRLSHQVRQQQQALEREARELQSCLEDRAKELRELYQREALARAEVEEAQRSRQELVAMVAHDLGQPLSTLRGYAELLSRPNTTPQVAERARAIIHSETGRMARLVEDLTSISESALYRFELRTALHDLATVAREQIELAESRTDRHTFVLDAPAELRARFDPDRLAQVIANLLNNAIDHTARGEIRLQVWAERTVGRISVCDHGTGIPADQIETIFEPRVRLTDGSSANRHRGMGLGLSIARSIVEAHGGKIWAENMPGGGAAFQVSLPLGKRPPRRRG